MDDVGQQRQQGSPAAWLNVNSVEELTPPAAAERTLSPVMVGDLPAETATLSGVAQDASTPA
jgi:hypothetical protein